MYRNKKKATIFLNLDGYPLWIVEARKSFDTYINIFSYLSLI